MRKLRMIAAGLAALVLLLAQGAVAVPDDDFHLRFPQLDEQTEFVNSWGADRSDGRSHQGTDLLGTKLAPVVAALDGVVEEMGQGQRSGYFVVLRHAGNVVTWYMHLNDDTPGSNDGRGGPEFAFAPGLEVGDVVAAGQTIGYVGDSGNAGGGHAHTHFELHINGRAVNPYRYLVGAWDRWQLELAIERGLTDFK